MLVLKRKDGQWIEITHNKSGEKIRFRVYNIINESPGLVHLAFDDANRNFEIQRPERFLRDNTTQKKKALSLTHT